MPISRATRSSFAVAIALHAVLVAKIATRPIAAVQQAAEATPIDLSFVELADALPRPTAPLDADGASLAPLAATTPRAQANGRAPAKDPLPPPSTNAPLPAEVSPLVGAAEGNQGVISPRTEASGAAAPRHVDFGLRMGSFPGGAQAPIDTIPTGPTGPRVEGSGREAPVDAAKILRAATDKHDVALGVGFGGPVAGAGRSALSSPSAPLGGRGRYEVRTNAAGQIVAVRALEGDAAWQAFAATLQAVLASRTLRVPEGARGVVVVVALEARQQEVAGAGSSVMRFDVANLAAGPSRVVSARVESERTL